MYQAMVPLLVQHPQRFIELVLMLGILEQPLLSAAAAALLAIEVEIRPSSMLPSAMVRCCS